MLTFTRNRTIFTMLMMMVNFLMIPNANALEMANKKTGGVLGAVKEIFVKGSIDGQNLFLVYGFGELADDVKREFKNERFGRRILNLGSLVHDQNHRNDYVDAFRDGVDLTGDSANMAEDGFKNIFKRPWRSLRKIPGAYEVSMDRARDAYYNSDSTISGVVKYSGHAIWANVKGAYYLIVEAPAKFALSALEGTVGVAGTVLALPGALVVHTLEIAVRATFIALDIVWYGLTTVAGATYSLLSTTTAGVATLVAATGVAIYKAGKWLLVDVRRPVVAKLRTELDLAVQTEFAQKVKEELAKLDWRFGEFNLKSKLDKYTSEFTFADKKGKKLGQVKVYVKEKKVALEAYLTSKFVRTVRKMEEFRDKKKSEVREVLQNELKTILQGLSVL